MKPNISPLLAKFAHQRILIWGVGREGISTYQFLRKYLPDQQLLLCDVQAFQDLPTPLQDQLKQDDYVSYLTQTPDLFEAQQFDFIFKSPGISPFQPPASQALNQGQSFWSNTRLFFELVSDQPNVITIGVTGTKGKSTTAMVIHHLLETAGKKTMLVGNIGRPALDVVENCLEQAATTEVCPVLELSSHQLLDLDHSPKIAVIQALSPEHLDYYPDVQHYYQAKQSITKYQRPEDMVLYFQPSDLAEQIARLSPAQTKIAFSPELNPDLLPQLTTALRGAHNLANILPGVIIAGHLAIESGVIEDALQTIRPLPHRLELVTTLNGVSYYNDSLSTTPVATIQALESFPDQPVILLAGGYERHQDYSQLTKSILAGHVPYLVLFPTTGHRLQTEVDQAAAAAGIAPPQTKMVSSMPEAVEFAREKAQPNSVVLLSPGAASFNLFRDYADRGDQFKELVKSLSSTSSLD
jgi:UDP-N-acetylmuramoylalanine--D-glutamate ligase